MTTSSTWPSFVGLPSVVPLPSIVVVVASSCSLALSARTSVLMASKSKLKVHSLAMMFHHPFTQELKAFVVLDELKINKAFRLQELIDHLLTFLISVKKSSLNFVVFLSNKKLFHLQRLIVLFDLPFCLCSFIHSLNQILS